MRTNALLLSVALAAGGTAMAQGTFSKNIVGYVNVTVPTSLVMIANPLNNGGNTVEEVVKINGEGELSLYHFTGTGYEVSEGLADEGETIWFAGGDIVVEPGGGFFAVATGGAAATITFVGEVAVGKSVAIPQGLSIVSSALPKAGGLDDLEFPDTVEGLIYQWGPGGYSAVDVFEGFFEPSVPQVGVAESFWVANTLASTSWVNSFTIE
jgi:hypothetical protein